MADFDLTQTDAQVQSILNDGQNMQGAGAQTTLTTESVLLKDVNGNYHKILKSSFTEAIRDTLAGLLVNNDKGTTINQIAAIANGDFGSITPANLASVLGATQKLNGVSFDNLTPGFYQWFQAEIASGDLSNPFINGVILVAGNTRFILQIASKSDGSAFKYRVKWDSWSSWKSVSLT